MNVSELFDPKLLVENIDNGNISQRKHPTVPLWIYNYTPQCAWNRSWNDATLNCRGLILDSNWNVVARPFKKFFNYGQEGIEFDLNVPAEVTDKADGSLGILYHYEKDGIWQHAIATRGSFESDQAIHATAVWNDKYKDLAIGSAFHTFLLEIVYPTNRIVLNYDGLDDLILLGAVQNSTGKVYGPEIAAALLCWDGPLVTTFEYKSLSEALTAPPRANAEGFVIRILDTDLMVKVKYEEYLELHRIVTNLNEKTIWEQLSSGMTLKDIVAPLPDEFAKWATGVCVRLNNEVEDIFRKVIKEFYEIMLDLSATSEAYQNPYNKDMNLRKKEFAVKALQSPYKALLFNLYDSKPVSPVIWKMIKPKVENV